MTNNEKLKLAEKLDHARHWKIVHGTDVSLSHQEMDLAMDALRAAAASAEPVAWRCYDLHYSDGRYVVSNDMPYVEWCKGRPQDWRVEPIPAPAPDAEIVAALEPFSEAWFAYGDKPSDDTPLSDNAGAAYLEGSKITFGDLRRAAAALTKAKGGSQK